MNPIISTTDTNSSARPGIEGQRLSPHLAHPDRDLLPSVVMVGDAASAQHEPSNNMEFEQRTSKTGVDTSCLLRSNSNEHRDKSSMTDNAQVQYPAYVDVLARFDAALSIGDGPAAVIVGDIQRLRQTARDYCRGKDYRIAIAPVKEQGGAGLCIVSKVEKSPAELWIEYSLKRAGYQVRRDPAGFRAIVREGQR